jgi:hypothetical protein
MVHVTKLTHPGVSDNPTRGLVNNKWGAAYKANAKLSLEPGVTMVFSRTVGPYKLRIQFT